MTVTDRYGLPLSTSSTAAAEHYQDGMDRLLSYGVDADRCLEAATSADEGFALAFAALALWHFFEGHGPAARDAITRARRLVGGTTRREQRHVEALAAIIADADTPRGLAVIDEQLAEFPRDALLVNQASSSIGFGGRVDREEFRLAFLERLAPSFGEDWWFDSALGFVYHEVGRFDESHRLSTRSLEHYPGNANASHNIAHVCFETLEHEAGVSFLSRWLEGYDARAPFRCHLAWHLALFELHRGDAGRALEVYAREIEPSSNERLAVMDGTALLWRVRLYGLDDCPASWQSLARLAARVSRPGFVFGDIHAALAYASCGDERSLSALVDALRDLETKGHPIAGTVVLPLVYGIAAFAAGDYAGALGHLEPIEAEIHRMGGSHAQWEVFEETMVVCYLRLGRLADAVRLLERRVARRATPRDLVWLREARAEAAQAVRREI